MKKNKIVDFKFVFFVVKMLFFIDIFKLISNKIIIHFLTTIFA